MARKVIDTTTNNGTYIGDPAKVAFDKVNDNFAELYGFGQADGSNLLINPELRINQRVFAGGALAANTYGYDRWRAGSSACNVTANNGVITHASGPLVQVLENPGLASTQVTLSVLSPSAALNVSIGGVTATIAAGTGRRSATVTLPSGATGNVIVQITATSASYRQLKLEVGAAATPFSARPWATELVMCQRYYEKSYNLSAKPGTAGAGDGRSTTLATGLPTAAHSWGQAVAFKVAKRANPAVTVYSHATGAVGYARDSTINGDVPAVVSAPGESGFLWYASAAGSPSSVNLECQWTADSEL